MDGLFGINPANTSAMAYVGVTRRGVPQSNVNPQADDQPGMPSGCPFPRLVVSETVEDMNQRSREDGDPIGVRSDLRGDQP